MPEEIQARSLAELARRVERLEAFAEPPEASPRAWPGEVADGNVITAAQINSIIASIQSWQGDVNANNYILHNIKINQTVTIVGDLGQDKRTTYLNPDGMLFSVGPIGGSADFYFNRYYPPGTYVDSPLRIQYATGSILMPNLKAAASDAAAAGLGVPVGGLYHNAGAVRIRLA